MEQKLSLGEQRVRTSFNPSNDGLVDQIKQKSAELINLVNGINDTVTSETGVYVNGEIRRLKALAQTEYESGAMWAVKAATA